MVLFLSPLRVVKIIGNFPVQGKNFKIDWKIFGRISRLHKYYERNGPKRSKFICFHDRIIMPLISCFGFTKKTKSPLFLALKNNCKIFMFFEAISAAKNFFLCLICADKNFSQNMLETFWSALFFILVILNIF